MHEISESGTWKSRIGCSRKSFAPGLLRRFRSGNRGRRSALSIRFLACILLLPAAAEATFNAPVQMVRKACGANPCTVTVTSTGAGHLLFLGINTLTNATISAISGEGTWTHGTKQIYGDGNTGGLDYSYVLSSTGGVTSIQVTSTGGVSDIVEIKFVEMSFTGSSVSLDDQQNAALSAVGNVNQPGVATTITGTNDWIIQYAAPDHGTINSISGSYTDPANFVGGTGYAGWRNTTTGTAPTWTLSAANKIIGIGVAFKEASAAAAVPLRALMGVGL